MLTSYFFTEPLDGNVFSDHVAFYYGLEGPEMFILASFNCLTKNVEVVYPEVSF